MSTVTEIRDAIRKLPPRDAWKLAEELLDGLWDKQFEQDVEAGRLDDMIARAREEHATGKTRPIDEISPQLKFARAEATRPEETGGET